jgi:hypothetical protein
MYSTSSSNQLWEKTIRDGNVAVIISPGYGAGWSTWNDDEYHNFFLYGTKEFINMIETGSSKEDLTTYVNSHLPTTPYFGGINTLTIEWVPIGTNFRIVEYDGSESVELVDYTKWETA